MKQKMYIASCSFGKDSIATILLASEHGEPLDRVVFAEVMFDNERGISGEIPEHIEWVYGTAIPKLENMGVKVDVVRAKKDYVTVCNTLLKSGKKAGQKYGVQSSFPCYANSELKLSPIRRYLSRYRKQYDIVQYIGIAIDETKRLKRLDGVKKISLLAKYGITEQSAMNLCKSYNLLSPLYSMGYRGGCWFCYNANKERYIHIRKNYPEFWQGLKNLYYDTDSLYMKYNKTFAQVEREMDELEFFQQRQLRLFD